jgi:hypothetical protein
MPSSSRRDVDEEDAALDREVDSLRDALREDDELSRDALGDAVGRKAWGPGRFARAVREALRRGTITSPGRRRYRRP